MTTNTNDTPSYGVTPDMLRQVFELSDRQAADRRAEQRRATEWPSTVDQAVYMLAREVGSLRARVDALEAAAKKG